MRVVYFVLFAAAAVYTMIAHTRTDSDLRMAMVAVGLASMTVVYPRLGLPGRTAVGWLSCILGLLIALIGLWQLGTDLGLQVVGSGLVLTSTGLTTALWPRKALEPSLLEWAGSEEE